MFLWTNCAFYQGEQGLPGSPGPDGPPGPMVRGFKGLCLKTCVLSEFLFIVNSLAGSSWFAWFERRHRCQRRKGEQTLNDPSARD